MTYFVLLSLTAEPGVVYKLIALLVEPLNRDDWDVSYVCLSHARPTLNKPSITVK